MKGGVGTLPEALRDRHHYVTYGRDVVHNTASVKAAGAYASLGVSNAFDMDEFVRGLSVQVTQLDRASRVMEFDLVGVDASLANALRRIVLADVPTMAVEQVWISKNTSVIPDELLAHRIGLVPLSADPEQYEYAPPGAEPTTRNTVEFRLSVRCPSRAESFAGNAAETFVRVRSGDMVAVGAAAGAVRPVDEKIVLVLLGPGQELEFSAQAVKGAGRTHAKWSPVSTVSYRLQPHISLLEDVRGDDAAALQRLCPLGVFDLEDVPAGPGARARGDGAAGRRLRVANPRLCSMCRECTRAPENERRVRLQRRRDHFLFSVESSCSLQPDIIVLRAVSVLRQKCVDLLAELDHIQEPP
jgi:DNA-directed RNA polymerase I and III subunit RPAC1